MSYLQDKKAKQKKFFYFSLFAVIVLVIIYFRLSIFSGLAVAGHVVFRPVLIITSNIGENLANVGSYFSSKKSLHLENENLRSQLAQKQNTLINYDSLLSENLSLKEILERKGGKSMILAAILAKPNQSPYDTLLIDVGEDKGVQVGSAIFALGNIPIGRVVEVFKNSSKAILFSSSGEKTQVAMSPKGVFFEIVGRGGGNFEMTTPRDFVLQKGDQALLPGIDPYVVGIVVTIISDPRDPVIKVLLVSPINIQEIRFVEVLVNK
jgi:cell shape-determining protein MreC